MSTSYKRTFSQIASSNSRSSTSIFGQVVKVTTSSNNIDLEGTITVRLSNGNMLTNVFPKHYGIQQLPTGQT